MNTYEKIISDGIESAKGYMRQIMGMGKYTGMYDLMNRIVYHANHYSVQKWNKTDSTECVTVESNVGHTDGSSIAVVFYVKTTGHLMFKKKNVTGYSVILREHDADNKRFYCKEYTHKFGEEGRVDDFCIKDYTSKCSMPEEEIAEVELEDKYYRCLRTLQVKNQVCYIFDGIKEELVDVYDKNGELVDREVNEKYVEGEILRRQRRNITNDRVRATFENEIKTEEVEAVVKKHRLTPDSKYTKMSLFQDFKTYMSEYFSYMLDEYLNENAFPGDLTKR